LYFGGEKKKGNKGKLREGREDTERLTCREFFARVHEEGTRRQERTKASLKKRGGKSGLASFQERAWEKGE